MLGLTAVAVAAAAGMFTQNLFNQVSTVKWIITVAAPVVPLFLLLTRRPVTYLAAATVALLPFSALSYGLGSVHISPVVVVEIVGVLVAFFSSNTSTSSPIEDRISGSNLLAPGSVATLLLLFPGAVRGVGVPDWFTQVAITAGLAYIICRACALDRHAPLIVAGTFVTGAGAQGLLAINEFRTGHVFNAYGGGVASYGSDYFYGYEGSFRSAGSFFDPISLGNMLALAIPIGFAIVCFQAFPKWVRAWSALCCVSAVSGLILTFSRMSWVAATAGIVLVIVLSPGRERWRQVGALVVGGAIVSSTAIGLAGPQLIQRFDSILHPTAEGVVTAQGDQTRQQLWHAALAVFGKHPIFGVGNGNLQTILHEQVGGVSVFSHAHSTYFQNLAESGLLGGAAIAVIYLCAASDISRRLRQNRQTDLFARACAGALIALSIVWLTDYTIRYTSVLACMAMPFILLVASRRTVRDTPGQLEALPLNRDDVLPDRQLVDA
ncbi:MAG: putative rane protein of ExoQ family [Frankiales bacterium]|nr:putative rane protein of ExoQ family [Frankiales bacterium]